MGEPRGTSRGGIEFANRMFLQDDDEIPDDQDAFTMGEIQPSTNFTNPVYETMFQDTRAPIIRPSATLLLHAPPSPSPQPQPQVHGTATRSPYRSD